MKKILMVEDQPEFHHLLSRLLSRQGYDVDAVLTASEALRRLDINRYDLVLTDFHFVGEDVTGEDVIAHTRLSCPYTRIAVHTVDPPGMHPQLSKDVEAWLLKPMLPAEFVAEIARILGS